MENRIQYILLAVSLAFTALLCPSSVFAAEESVPEETLDWDDASQIVEPEIKRNKIDIAKIDALDIETGVFYGQMSVEDFGTNAIVGVTFGSHVTEDIFVRASFGKTDTEQTSFEVISGARLLTDSERDLQYYDLSVGLNLLPGEGFVGKSYAFNSTFYGLIGVGSTDFAGDQRFTVSAGVGYRVVLKDWLSLQVEVKDHIFDIDILGADKTTHNISYILGFTVFY